MHEVVHLSFGPQANSLNCLFYNQQQKYFVYNKSDLAKSNVDPHIRFVYGREFTPRAVFWDYRNGFGKLKQFRHDFEGELSSDALQKMNVPMTDNNQWADIAEFPMHHSSMFKIPDWETLPTNKLGIQRGAPEGQDQPFEMKDMGEEEFSAACHILNGNGEDYLDTTFRLQMEKCDLLEGVNLVTDLGGWGGFSSKYLSLLRDDYVQKQPIFSWVLSRPLQKIYPKKLPLALQLSRVETIAELSEFSSLVLPLQNGTDTNFMVNAENHLPTFESMCLLSSMRRNRISMESIVEDLTLDLPKANIVQVNNEIISEFNNCKKITSRNKVVINRPASIVTNSDNTQAHDNTLQPQLPEPTVQHNGGRDQQETIINCPQSSNTNKSLQVSFEVNDRPLALRELVRRFASHDLRELVGDLTDNYSWKWESDSDWD